MTGHDWQIRTVLALLVSASGCSSDSPDVVPDAGAVDAAHPEEVTLAPCSDLPQLPTSTRCGTLTVALDRQDPAAGTTVVAFAMIPRRDQRQPSLGTITTNPGGPGTSTIDFAGPLYAAALDSLLDRRELLLIDPRGVGRSSQVSCPALADPGRAFASLQRQRELIGACGAELGHKARYYGTSAVADDVDEIRAALGVDKLDLLGDSYGTFLMAVYAQRHPEHVRSVVLSGAYAVNISSSGSVGARALRRAITLVGERTGAFSGATVLEDLAVIAAQLRAHPEPLEVTFGNQVYAAVLDEWTLAGAVGKLYSGVPVLEAQTALATAAHAARGGDLRQLAALVRDHMTEMAATYSDSAAYSDVASWAATCHDYPRTFDYADDVATRARAYSADLAALDDADFAPFSALAWNTRDSYDSGACLSWPNDPTATTPFPAGTVLADLPVLVLSGDLDANTASASGQEAAAQFPHAQWLEVKDAGHTPSLSAEGQQLILAFLGQAR